MEIRKTWVAWNRVNFVCKPLNCKNDNFLEECALCRLQRLTEGVEMMCGTIVHVQPAKNFWCVPLEMVCEAGKAGI